MSAAEPRGFPLAKAGFPDLDLGVAHFAGGGQTPLPASARAAVEAFFRRKADGFSGYAAHWAVADRARARLGQMVGAGADDVAFVGSASDGISRIVEALDWRSGDRAVMAANDYASGRAALSALSDRGVTLTQVPAEGNAVSEDALIAACDGRTRLLYVSQVNPLTGQRFDIAKLSRALSPRGVFVLNDATHAMGALPVNAADADATVSSCYKFLAASFMGVLVTGTGRGRALAPSSGGWYSLGAGDTARRFEYGNVPHLDVAILDAVLAWHLSLDPAAREVHLLTTARRIADHLRDAGFAPLAHAPGAASHNVCVFSPHAEALAEGLEARGVRVWCDHGRVRLSAQVFNDETDLQRLASALSELRTTGIMTGELE